MTYYRSPFTNLIYGFIVSGADLEYTEKYF